MNFFCLDSKKLFMCARDDRQAYIIMPWAECYCTVMTINVVREQLAFHILLFQHAGLFNDCLIFNIPMFAVRESQSCRSARQSGEWYSIFSQQNDKRASCNPADMLYHHLIFCIPNLKRYSNILISWKAGEATECHATDPAIFNIPIFCDILVFFYLRK